MTALHTKRKTHDQICTVLPEGSALQIMRISVSLNLMIHFFCIFSTVCIIPIHFSHWSLLRYMQIGEQLTRESGDIVDVGAKAHSRLLGMDIIQGYIV